MLYFFFKIYKCEDYQNKEVNEKTEFFKIGLILIPHIFYIIKLL